MNLRQDQDQNPRLKERGALRHSAQTADVGLRFDIREWGYPYK